MSDDQARSAENGEVTRSRTWSTECPCGRAHGTPTKSRVTCDACGHTHAARDAVTLSRFTGVTGYRTSDGEIHATREDAQQWLCEKRQGPTPIETCACGLTDPEMPCFDCRYSPAKTLSEGVTHATEGGH